MDVIIWSVLKAQYKCPICCLEKQIILKVTALLLNIDGTYGGGDFGSCENEADEAIQRLYLCCQVLLHQ